MKKLVQSIAALIIFFSIAISSYGQEYPFKTTTYYYRLPNDSLISSGLNLSQFNFSSANFAVDSIFHDGIYFPASDCFGRNLWIRLRHVASDPNGTSVGINVSVTTSNPCQSNIMIGGWAGFLYDFEIHQDGNLIGNRNYFLGTLYPTSITVASLETLSGGCGGSEWLSFKIINSGSTGWNLNSINFTGSNTTSNPAFSDTMAVYTTGGCYPPDGFSYIFPTGADSISFINASTVAYSEFKMSAGTVSHFRYGYEFSGGSGGYQGMSMAFGSAPTFSFSSTDATCLHGNNGEINVNISGGIGPFTYQWDNVNNSGDSLAGLSAGTYHLTVTDQNGCGTIADTTIIINEPLSVTVALDSSATTNVHCHGGTDGSIQVFGSGIAPITYQWSTGVTDSIANNLSAGNYFVTISDLNTCIVIYDTITEPPTIDTSLNFDGTTITANETGATFQWLNCNGNTVITDSTSVSITPSVSGDYEVAITKNGCADTSACVNITIISVSEIFASSVNFSVSPNPSNGNVIVTLDKVSSSTDIIVTDLNGRIVFTKNESNKKSIELNLSLQQGFYFISLKTNDGSVVKKLLIE